MALTDIAIRRAKSREKPYKLFDEKGMYLLVSPSGGKLWRLKYRVSGKEKTLALGPYPERSLAEARDQRDEARKLVRNGVDPGEERKREKRDQKVRSVNTFRLLANEWHQAQLAKWTPHHAASIARRLEVDLLPSLGDRPVAEIEAPELLATLRTIEKRGSHDIAHRVLQIAGQVFRYAIVLGRANRDPSRDLKGALVVPARVRHHAALTEAELPEFLDKLDRFDGHLQTQQAMKLLLLTFVRTGELRGAKWAEIDFEKAQWRIPAERMKTGRDHIVPLSKQALVVLRELQKLNGHRLILFPNQAKPTLPMSENTILFALYRMGYHSRATGHGFRATASTILNEQGWRSDVIELQLAHAERNKVRAAYNRAEYLPERRKLMQHWADFLDKTAREAKEEQDAEAAASA